MKPLIYALTLFSTLSIDSYATTRTVSNDGAGGSQFSTLLAGYNASSNGDTLLVEGTNVQMIHSVTGLTWDKNVVVIGIGFNPQKQNAKRTLATFFCSPGNNEFAMTAGGSGSKFYGIEFTASVVFRGSVANLTFENCKFDALLNCNNQSVIGLNVKNCIFDIDNNQNIVFSSTATNSNILISNCSFDGAIEGSSNTTLSVTIDHCQFLVTAVNPFNSVKFALVKNCVFMNRGTLQTGGTTGISFNNNISRLGVLPAGSGNIDTASPNFVSYTNGTLYLASHDYHLNSGSPAIGMASDSTDIGIHGGFSNFNESGEVLITPIVRSLIMNNIIAPNGTLNIKINATKPKDN